MPVVFVEVDVKEIRHVRLIMHVGVVESHADILVEEFLQAGADLVAIVTARAAKEVQAIGVVVAVAEETVLGVEDGIFEKRHAESLQRNFDASGHHVAVVDNVRAVGVRPPVAIPEIQTARSLQEINRLRHTNRICRAPHRSADTSSTLGRVSYLDLETNELVTAELADLIDESALGVDPDLVKQTHAAFVDARGHLWITVEDSKTLIELDFDQTLNGTLNPNINSRTGRAIVHRIPTTALVPTTQFAPFVQPHGLGTVVDDRTGEPYIYFTDDDGGLSAICLCRAMSRTQAEDRQDNLFPRMNPHCPRNQVSQRSTTVRGQSPHRSPGVGGPATLPRGRAYYNNRYFGNFNNRYYGPQYGYF